jgi:DNA-binding CsgD family transcriptional regulator
MTLGARKHSAGDKILSLSDRQLEVVKWAAHGLTSAQTAPRMYCSLETVKTHRKKVIDRLGARNMTHAVAIVAMNAPELLRR